MSANKDQALDETIFNKLIRLFVLTLSGVALLIIAVYIFFDNQFQIDEWLILVLIVLVLIGCFFLIFKPAALKIKSTIKDLLIAEQKAKKMAFDADVLSEAKEKSVKELRALSQALDDTLLFARITPNGIVLHMGNKFSRLFKFKKFT